MKDTNKPIPKQILDFPFLIPTGSNPVATEVTVTGYVLKQKYGSSEGNPDW